MANELENKSLLPLHLGASTADGFLLEAAVVKDTTKNQDLQKSLDALFAAVGDGEHGSVASVTANSTDAATVITVTMADGTSAEINLKQYDDAEVRSLINEAKEAASAASTKVDTEIGKLNADVTSTGNNQISVKVTEEAGKVTEVTVTADEFAKQNEVKGALEGFKGFPTAEGTATTETVKEYVDSEINKVTSSSNQIGERVSALEGKHVEGKTVAQEVTDGIASISEVSKSNDAGSDVVVTVNTKSGSVASVAVDSSVLAGKVSKNAEDIAELGRVAHVDSLGGKTGVITVDGEGAGSYPVKLAMTDQKLGATIEGLGTAAAKNVSDFDAAGDADAAKNAAIEAASTDATNKANQALADAKAYADGKVARVSAKDNSIVIDTTSEGASATAPKVGVQLSATPGILRLEADGLSAVMPAETPYTGADAVVVDGHAISLKLVDDKVLSQNAEGLKTNLGVKITKKEDNKSYIQIVGIGGAVVAEADASAFVVDGMLADASFDEASHILTLTLNVDGGSKTITADLSSLVDVYTASKGIDKVGSDFQIKLDATASESFLKVDEKGLRTEGIATAIATAKSEAISDAEGKIATAKQEAIEAAAADATTKADAALASAKEYADGKVASTANYFTQDITASGTTIAATTHKCGLHPMIQCFVNNELVETAVTVDATGSVTVSWNGTIDKVTVVIVGK